MVFFRKRTFRVLPGCKSPKTELRIGPGKSGEPMKEPIELAQEKSLGRKPRFEVKDFYFKNRRRGDGNVRRGGATGNR